MKLGTAARRYGGEFQREWGGGHAHSVYSQDRRPYQRRDAVGRHSGETRRGIDYLWARDRITVTRKRAADQSEGLCYRAMSGGVQAVDYSRQRVSGARGNAGPNTRRLEARDEIAAITERLGADTVRLLQQVVIEDCSLRSLARAAVAEAGDGNETWKARVLSKKPSSALDALDAYWHAAPAGSRGIRSTGHAAGEVLVEMPPVDKFEGMSAEELAAHTYQVGESLKRMARSKRKKPEPVRANDNRIVAKHFA